MQKTQEERYTSNLYRTIWRLFQKEVRAMEKATRRDGGEH